MKEQLEIAVAAAKEAGALLRAECGSPLTVNETTQHDIKLELDVRSQDLITGRLLEAYPDHAIYGEEGMAGDQNSPWQWIVDPIDGTVNFYYGIPHFCISIALRHEGTIVLGVIYDPMQDELWTVADGIAPTLNGQPISVSPRENLNEAIITVGFAKTRESLDLGMPKFQELSYQVRKIRILGSAALAMAYISCGRLDGYLENKISLWDIAAGDLLVRAAGGKVKLVPHSAEEPDVFAIEASNGKLDFDGA
ncbi:MAG: inositol monophosphatase family protein [Verrucomicrobiota bacterium]